MLGVKKMNKKIFGLLAIALILAVSLAVSGSALSAAEIANLKVEVNDDDVTSITSLKDFDKTDELEIMVAFDYSNSSLQTDMQIEASLRGYDHPDLIEDISDVFTAKPGNRYTEILKLKLPSRMDAGNYDLRIWFTATTGDAYEVRFPLDISGKRHSLEIRDIVLSPENEVRAGSYLIVNVRIKNRGEKAEEDVKVKVSIPALGSSASAYIDELDEGDCTGTDCDDSATSEDLFLKIPDNAETGDYTVKVDVEFDDGDETDSMTTKIKVVGEEGASAPIAPASKTIITVGPETQNIAQGATVVYPITITNAGTSSKTYTVNVDGANWATFQVSPSNVVVLNAGESKSLYIYVTASQTTAAGEQMFSVTVLSGSETLKQVPLKATVTSQAAAAFGWSKIKKALEIGLVVLVVLLVILGLIIGFNKLKGSEEESKDEEGKTYY